MPPLRAAVYDRVGACCQAEGAERWQAYLIALVQQLGQHVGQVLQHLFGRSPAHSAVAGYNLGQLVLLHDGAVHYAWEEPWLAVLAVSLWWHLLPFYVYGHCQLVLVWFVICSLGVRDAVLHRSALGWTVRASILHCRMQHTPTTVQPWAERWRSTLHALADCAKIGIKGGFARLSSLLSHALEKVAEALPCVCFLHRRVERPSSECCGTCRESHIAVLLARERRPSAYRLSPMSITLLAHGQRPCASWATQFLWNSQGSWLCL